MTNEERHFPRPWRRMRTPEGFLVVDGEGKKLLYALGHDRPATFADLSLEEAASIADTVVRIPELLDLEAHPKVAAPLEPLLVLTQSKGKWHILRDCHSGILQQSRPFDTKDAAIYACTVWYGGEPAMPVEPAIEMPAETPPMKAGATNGATKLHDWNDEMQADIPSEDENDAPSHFEDEQK